MAVFQASRIVFAVPQPTSVCLVSSSLAVDRIDQRDLVWVHRLLQLRAARTGQGYSRLQVKLSLPVHLPSASSVFYIIVHNCIIPLLNFIPSSEGSSLELGASTPDPTSAFLSSFGTRTSMPETYDLGSSISCSASSLASGMSALASCFGCALPCCAESCWGFPHADWRLLGKLIDS